jgi:hypothetical protein
MGINRQLPHLGDRGRGVNRKLPHLGNRGIGINRLVESQSRRDWLLQYFTDLSSRLRRVRVACGDWSRVLTPPITFFHGLTGIVLDPPYGEGSVEYTAGGNKSDLSHKVRGWCLENGDNPKLRIALCGYNGQFDMPSNWTTVAWKAAGGYGSAGKQDSQAKENSHRERIWFSPHCLKADTPEEDSLYS